MVWPVTDCKDGKGEVAAANEPDIRLSSDTLWPNYETPKGGWVVCSPPTVGRFSAIMYYFRRDLQRELKVPVGLICRAVSASAACPWISISGGKAEIMSGTTKVSTDVAGSVVRLVQKPSGD